MDKKIAKTILFLGILLIFFLGTRFVSALEVQYPSILGHSINDKTDLVGYLCYIIGVIMDLAVVFASIAIAWGGIYYLISYGSGKFTNEGKDIIKSAILGLLIIVCSILIANTINPNLTSCKIGVLSLLGLNSISSDTTNPYKSPTATYKEIPIGNLTETLLTRKVGCYGFDAEGNPIDGEEITTDEGDKEKGPTFMNHDRADCLLQLVEGAQKKAQVVAALSDEITKLMNQCDCEKYGDCKPKCDPLKGCQTTGACPGGSCIGDCIGGACLRSTVPDCCPDGVKNKIEHGSITVSVDVGGTTGGSCKTQEKQFQGLDEFRCVSPKQCSGIMDLVEREVVVKKEKIKLIDQAKWKQLNLTQQLIYFKEKIDDLKEKIRADENILAQAATLLDSPQCFLAVPSVDLFRTYTTTNQKDKYITINKDSYPDPETGEKVTAAKYCVGFNYNNSSCFKKCNDECPDTSGKAMKAYADIKDCNNKPNDPDCLLKQKADTKKAYNERPCVFGNNDSQTFEGCISSCQNDCSTNCAKKYLVCSNDYNICKNQCDSNSKCVLNNEDTCLTNPQAFKDCTSRASDQTSIDNCISNAYLCKNGSDQYAGYPDCSNLSGDSLIFNSTSAPADVWTDGCSSDQYSASYFYENPDCQKCPKPYGPPAPGSDCATAAVNKNLNAAQPESESSANKKITTLCQDVCPETSKCPPASSCPNCPCDKLTGQTFKFSVPNESTKDNAGNEGYVTRETKISDDLSHQIVGPECNGYSYNDDPLAFYCQDEWWNEPDREGQNKVPIGTQRMCLPGGEIPVGQTVDNAKKWAEGLINSADKMKKNIEDILAQMEKAGKAKDTSPIQNYCMCDAKLESALPICKTDCEFKQDWIPASDDGTIPGHWVCNCNFVPCKGKPCEQIIDYLSQLWNDYRQFKQDFIDFYTVMATEPRSDIMKELAYSRNQANKCSVSRNNYGTESRLLSCNRAEAEVMSPIIGGNIIYNGKKVKSYCYGKDLNASLTDNWFCCQTFSVEQQDDNQIDHNALP